jgi:phenylalanyl-tRNA synthetase beta chain
MRVPVEWLHEYCAPALSTLDLAERLAMTGTEVERVEHHGVRGLEHFVVGLVVEAEPHPNADRLKACLVDVGEQSPVQIVCGAPNVAAGQTVAVARPGAVMPDGTTLNRTELRGLESNGMILAEDELAIGTDHGGILVLDEHGEQGLTPGSPLSAVLPLATDVLELEVTPNRPDCLSIYGVAREAHAATGAPLADPPWQEDPGAPGDVAGIAISVQTPPELCPRFTARVFEHVTIGPSPAWLKARLMAAGQRPISNVVDITNYVMLLTGQPLHAFDLDRVAGARLTIRVAQPDEQVVTLDGQARILDEQMVVIDDADGPTSIAGVMGGERSEVHDGTTRVLMEAATWNGPNIQRTSKRLGLRSEASSRFEKQTQPEQAMEAQAVAAKLMVELCGARLMPGTIDIGGAGPRPQHIMLRDERVRSLLGAPVQRAQSLQILTALGFQSRETADGLDVGVPAHRRRDVTREADLIEEVARLGALDTLPATLPSRHGASGRLTVKQRLRRRAVDALAGNGLHEIVGWSFVSPDLPRRLRHPDGQEARRRPVVLSNPMSGEQSRLRTTLLGSLLDAARHNRAHGAVEIRLFESGAVYLAGEDSWQLPAEPHHLAALVAAPARPATWREPNPPAGDFFAIKGILTALLQTLRVTFELEPAHEPFLHPGRAAAIAAAGEPVGWIGELHPLVAAEWDLADAPVAAFEVDFDALAGLAPETTLYRERTSFPAVREDLAVIVSADVSAAQVTDAVRRAGGPLLQDAHVFDVYRDNERIGAGNVSLALRLTFAAADRTLTDDEVADCRRVIGETLSTDLGGRVRDR